VAAAMAAPKGRRQGELKRRFPPLLAQHLDREAAGQLDELLLVPAVNGARLVAGDLSQRPRAQLWRAGLVRNHPHLRAEAISRYRFRLRCGEAAPRSMPQGGCGGTEAGNCLARQGSSAHLPACTSASAVQRDQPDARRTSQVDDSPYHKRQLCAPARRAERRAPPPGGRSAAAPPSETPPRLNKVGLGIKIAHLARQHTRQGDELLLQEVDQTRHRLLGCHKDPLLDAVHVEELIGAPQLRRVSAGVSCRVLGGILGTASSVT